MKLHDLSDLAARIERGERLSAADAERLWSTPHLHALRELADRVRHRLHGDRVARVRASSGPGAAVLSARAATVASLLALRDQHHASVLVRDKSTALELLRVIACARLVLDDVPHIAASAAELGRELSQLALDWGADQLVEVALEEVAA